MGLGDSRQSLRDLKAPKGVYGTPWKCMGTQKDPNGVQGAQVDSNGDLGAF